MSRPLDPAWDPALRDHVTGTLDQLIQATRAVLERTCDEDDALDPPSDIAEFGDASGLIEYGYASIIDPLQAALDHARAELDAVYARIDSQRATALGPGYRPRRRER